MEQRETTELARGESWGMGLGELAESSAAASASGEEGLLRWNKDLSEFWWFRRMFSHIPSIFAHSIASFFNSIQRFITLSVIIAHCSLFIAITTHFASPLGDLDPFTFSLPHQLSIPIFIYLFLFNSASLFTTTIFLRKYFTFFHTYPLF